MKSSHAIRKPRQIWITEVVSAKKMVRQTVSTKSVPSKVQLKLSQPSQPLNWVESVLSLKDRKIRKTKG